MSGRYEKDIQIDNTIKKRLNGLPTIITDYYYSLLSEGKSYRTAQTYIDRLERFIKFVFRARFVPNKNSYKCFNSFSTC